ncbi:hypothetical protein C8R48DRAFT_668531 [Suillus tomentosus]|nr:hypothetical protein C8R48DRAFT_668531 [Suillus tomentosus]
MAAAYPEYVACFEASLWVFFSGEPPAGQLRFALPEVANFTASLLTNIAKTLASHYFRESAPITHGALIAQGKTPVVWEVSNEDGRSLYYALKRDYCDSSGAGERPNWVGLHILECTRCERASLGRTEVAAPSESGPSLIPKISTRSCGHALHHQQKFSGVGSSPLALHSTSPKHFLVCMTSGIGWYSAASMPSIPLQPQWSLVHQKLTYIEKFVPRLCKNSRGKMEVDEMFE